MKKLLYILGLFLILQSCNSSKKLLNKPLFTDSNPYFSGLLVYNPATGDTLINHNGEKYFTPASTIKLFTLYASLKTLGDSIATIAYKKQNDTLFFKGLADPTFLHDSLPNKTYDFLAKTTNKLVLVKDNFDDFIYGSGWQWDDFEFYYMPEKSIFPIYGNLATLTDDGIIPNYFQKDIKTSNKFDFHRDFDKNVFYKDSVPKGKLRKIPFKTSLALTAELLSDTLHKPIKLIPNYLATTNFTPYISTPTLPIYKQLMNESENFLAEQLMLILAKKKTGHYKVSNAIEYVKDSLLSSIPNKPRWVDGSGLSRYNLFTPKSMIFLLNKMYNEIDHTTLFDLLPRNGEDGSLQKWYPYEKTYLYAKTGSLSNNHSICGYLITKKGNTLLFSYMNNNYRIQSGELRNKMNKVLQEIYNTY